MVDNQKETPKSIGIEIKNEQLKYRKLIFRKKKTYEEMHKLQAEYEKEINAEEVTLEEINLYIAEVRNAGNS